MWFCRKNKRGEDGQRHGALFECATHQGLIQLTEGHASGMNERVRARPVGRKLGRYVLATSCR